MGLADFQSMYLAHRLTLRRAGNDVEKIAGTLSEAQVELNPHQIDAALFAFQSPLSQGVILADEVGLGKTIEAGLVLAQNWAERKRRLLVIVPASLQKQWSSELLEKFYLPNVIMERQRLNRLRRDGIENPFELDSQVQILSYQFAASNAELIQQVPWDLVVMDEAHILRNVYKEGAKTARRVRDAVGGSRKLLLTATPLQNSLNELYGLVSVIDPHVFGDRRSFAAQYANPRNADYAELKQRLEPIARRTLRRQVTAFIPYTRRIPLVQEFMPTPEEVILYDMVGDYLAGDRLQALPASQRHLITLMLQKLQASSTFALAPTLDRLSGRLRNQLLEHSIDPAIADDLLENDDLLETESGEELLASDETGDIEDPDGVDLALQADPSPLTAAALVPPVAEPLDERTVALIRSELAELDTLAGLAREVRQNAKGEALLAGLREAFRKADGLGAPRKALIFTEFRRTQDYILSLLRAAPEFADNVVLFNGSNSDAESREIYGRWLERNKGTGRISGSAAADRRQALVDEFRERGQIMIATEAAAQGLNLQFCSLVINYDLPWNPQRIEQRIGRCHRYGQKFDVVVVNFLDKHNAADQRVYELLNEKYQLFEGVFGASDDVLGDIGSGINLEKRIAEIYRTARTPDAIDRQFKQLQLEFQPQITDQMMQTRARLFEHFDEEVAERLQIRQGETSAALKGVEQDLMLLTRTELGDHATFHDDSSFTLSSSPIAEPMDLGLYALPRRNERAHVYRLGHPLAAHLIDRAKERSLPDEQITFDYDAYGRKVTVLERLQGKRGHLVCTLMSLEGASEAEDHLMVAAITDDGEHLAPDIAERLLLLPTVPAVGADPVV